jgi:hypothetical protein
VSITPLLSPVKNETGFETCVAGLTDALVQPVLGQSQ